ncbi:uncharacterized protein CcaverHIS019_0206180 [Cutaneotrichosporon cavernicola]|uniref:Histone deacetylase domain-containing protein n=1 Tax=Cutaneotrichosporon cavernicola TaxID=279322 RepID=A0AA48L009_9TREE|nr:uncharacterized protein CcaverHIS019_0206180 [Cutaneotrichosporon cavernicola]BEI89256.1 hypothetical protein CcaverHIS019_0206180 [Cutaneotrichosporon cavernicola]BEI97032.1 hypothetical protein CcaverHIS631_0206210 [Cutaneotrichosporon cavernicola]BEJ04806.1 hypothetical protein CcaverHIS641_0206230 [Cutaneotrichosporon cavernicola]
MTPVVTPPLALHIQPACLEHKYIRHKDSSHIFERPERLRAVLLGFAAALARLEAADGRRNDADGLSALLGSLSISSFLTPTHLSVVPPPVPPSRPGQVLLHHPALQLAHSPPIDAPFPYLPRGGGAMPQSTYLKDLFKWASEAVETIRTTGCEIPQDKGLNVGDLYLGPGSVVAIEGAVQSVCHAVDGICADDGPSKAFCAIRPPGHHCGEDEPSGFCYVNNVVVGAMHAYLQHDIDRAVIIDFDLHHGNGTQALVMPLNAASYAEDLAVAAGKPPSDMRGRSGRRRTWKGFYGSVHDIYSYPCEDGDLDLIGDASISLAAHGQYIENIHLQPYEDEADFYKRIYPLYLALLEKARVFMRDTQADPEKTVLFISAGFDACEHEHQGMQRHDRRVPASFYARYTRDIATFADKYMGGKVISVLEGGYGDRALTSAALGHAVGLMGREGSPDWWGVDELVLLERAVKKRRKGKLCSLPPDLAQKPHIARTHAILSHWEEHGTPTPSAAPSANATPSGRMTLRERRTRDKEEESPRPAPRRKPKSAPKERETSPTPSVPFAESKEAYPSPVSLPSPDKPDIKTEHAPMPAGAAPLSAGTQNALHPVADVEPIVLRIPARTPEPDHAPVLRIPARVSPPPSSQPAVQPQAPSELSRPPAVQPRPASSDVLPQLAVVQPRPPPQPVRAPPVVNPGPPSRPPTLTRMSNLPPKSAGYSQPHPAVYAHAQFGHPAQPMPQMPHPSQFQPHIPHPLPFLQLPHPSQLQALYPTPIPNGLAQPGVRPAYSGTPEAGSGV